MIKSSSSIESLIYLVERGDLLTAKSEVSRLLKTRKKDSDLWHILGLIHYKSGHFRKAVEAIKKAIKLNSSVGVYHKNLALSLLSSKKDKQAVSSLKRAISIDNYDVQLYRILGKILGGLGQNESAISCYKEGIQYNPEDVDLHNDLSIALLRLGDKKEAFNVFKKALKLEPDNENILINLGNFYQEENNLEKAALYFFKAIEVNPNNAIVHNNIGNTFSKLRQKDKALHHYERALEIDPYFKNPYNGIGKIHMDSKEYNKAIQLFRKAIDIDQNYHKAHRNLSYALLANNNFTVGWKEYEWREALDRVLRLNPKIELWHGQPLKGKSILIYAEQGIGDEIMFASCLPDLLKKRPGEIFLECDSRLTPIFHRSFPIVKNIDRNSDELKARKDIDYHVAIGSLPKVFRVNKDNFTGDKYLEPSPKKINKWQNRYREVGIGLKVGISWNSSKAKPLLSDIRSIDILSWKGIFDAKGVQFINLQYGDCRKDLNTIQKKFGITIYDWDDSNPLLDMDDFFAKVAALDLVISIDNSTAHVAGSIGVETIVLVPYASDWRWEGGMKWYHSLELIKQKREGCWTDVMNQAAHLLSIKGK